LATAAWVRIRET